MSQQGQPRDLALRAARRRRSRPSRQLTWRTRSSSSPSASRPGAVAAGLTVATAESCTGGLVAHAAHRGPGLVRATCAAGSSRTRTRSSARELGVPADVLEAHGAVSAQVALAMAEGVRARLATDLGVGVTGVAGPGRRLRGEARRPRVRRGRRARPGRRPPLPSGPATGPRTSAPAPRPRSSCSSRRSTRRADARVTVRGAAAIGAGLAPAARPRGRSGPASGSTSSARRAPARPRRRCSPRGPARTSTAATPAARRQYTPALDAAGIRVADAHDAAHVTAAAGRRTGSR